MKWTDVEEIAETLEGKFPDEDIYALRFTKLKDMVINLDEFDDAPDRSNEKVLEAIQAEWAAHREENNS